MNRNDYRKLWESYWGDMQRYGPQHRHKFRILSDIIRNLEFSSFLDVGCGSGLLFPAVRKIKGSIRASGIDVSSAYFREIESRYGIECRVMDIQEEFLDEKFDLITCIDLLEHLKDDDKALENIYKMANKYLLISTLTGRMRSYESFYGHLRNYTKESLCQKLERAGFKVRKVLNWGFPIFSPFYRNIALLSGPHFPGGGYSLNKKIICQILYALYFFNLPDMGDAIFVLAEVVSRGEDARQGDR